ncbi:hypothetical protein LTR66_000846 [Elasticomyces elasticus]|nr:hypothetical protein LTR66_000846 [Elasticomyces elasticus]
MHEDAETSGHASLYEQDNHKATIALDAERFPSTSIAVSQSPSQANLCRDLKGLMLSSMKIGRSQINAKLEFAANDWFWVREIGEGKLTLC